MPELLEQLTAGLGSGLIYSGLGLAIVLLYRATGFVNFAQGEMAMMSTYCAHSLLQRGWGYGPAVALTLVATAAAGAALYWWLVRPLGEQAPWRATLVSIGLMLLLNSLAGAVFSYAPRAFPSPFPEMPLHLAGAVVSAHRFGQTCVTLAVVGGLFVFFRRADVGLAMRAAAHAPGACRLLGVRVQRITAIAWALAASLGAIMGVMAAPTLAVEPNMMGGVLIYALAAATLGGMASPVGALVGGVLVGVGENLLGSYVPALGTQLKLTVGLALIVAVVTLRPAGLMGRASARRV